MSGAIGPVDWHQSADELHERYKERSETWKVRKRLGALWLVRRGESVSGAAQSMGVGRRTLTRWLSWYRKGGLEGVLSRVPGHGASGNECRLSERQQQELVGRAGRGELRTYEEARRRWVEQESGASSTATRGSTRCWLAWGFVRRYRGPRPPRRPIPKRARGVGKGGLLEALGRAGLRSGREAWRSEEMRLGLRGQTRKVLAPKGVGAVQPLQLVYEWSYLVLAVSPLTGEEIGWEWI